jgi:tRNA-splicing ligase RtcB
MQVIKEEGAAPIKAWVGTKTFNPKTGTFVQALLTRDGPGGDEIPAIEDSALRQLKNLSRMSFLFKNGVAAMADVHAGKGSTVGSVIATTNAIMPSTVGVDGGCGVRAICTTLSASDLPDSLAPLRGQIERDVPTGFGEHNDIAKVETEHRKYLPEIPPALYDRMGLFARDGMQSTSIRKALKQLGSLGGGNHFIEICLDM